jgi:2-iminobutanoate/2-iminopropanoate deaminase
MVNDKVVRRYINLPGRPGDFPFSDGVFVGDTLYIAGRIGIDPATGRVPNDIEQEIRFMLDSVQAILAEAAMTMDDLVSATVFCPDLSLFEIFNKIYRSYFQREFPARAFIGSGPLLLGGHFEIIGVGIKR